MISRRKGTYAQGFYIDQPAGWIYMTGSPETDTWTMRYFPRCTKIDDGDDVTCIPDRLEEECLEAFIRYLAELNKDRDERSAADIVGDAQRKFQSIVQVGFGYKSTPNIVSLDNAREYQRNRFNYSVREQND